jgi:hypothetical protein
MTAAEIFYLIFGAGLGFVIFLVLRKNKKKVKTQSNEHVVLQIIREKKPEILEEIDIEKIVLSVAQPVSESSKIGPYNASDLTSFLAAYGTVNALWNLDKSEDGIVSSQDLLIFLANYGTVTPSFPDIIPAWNNFYNHAPSSNVNLGFDLFPIVQDEGVVWNDIKDECSVQWYYNGILCSEDKDKCRFVDAVTRAGLCSGQFPLTCRITHNPSGKVFERTACSHIFLTDTEGWFELNPNLTNCNTECSLATIENLWAGPFDEYEFLTN